MIVYNITIKTDWIIHERWLAWMKSEMIPGILDTKLFYQSRFLRLLETEDADGPTYAVQFHAHSIADYHRYMQLFSLPHYQQAAALWGTQYIAFNTVMLEVEL